MKELKDFAVSEFIRTLVLLGATVYVIATGLWRIVTRLWALTDPSKELTLRGHPEDGMTPGR